MSQLNLRLPNLGVIRLGGAVRSHGVYRRGSRFGKVKPKTRLSTPKIPALRQSGNSACEELIEKEWKIIKLEVKCY